MGSQDTPTERLVRTKFFMSSMVDDVDGPDGAKEIQTFINSYEGNAHYLGEQFRRLLVGNESDFSKIAGRLKYVGASLKILKLCGELAVTTDGLCRQIAKLCMSNIYGEVEGLKDTLEQTKDAARVHHVDEPMEIRKS